MQRPDAPRNNACVEPQPCDSEKKCERAFSISNFCVVAVMLTIALGAVVIECAFYKAFDDNRFDFERSALPTVLYLPGLQTPPKNVTTRPARPDVAR
ncbi:hypothetical protein [Variovorax sp. 38R]|uniref:hypothetical protein n=1 Tax=Variovorax sp. 38R TaxID=2774875 RepID=UPI001785AC12|nr:hypothetical protein [Variovorax sp. 38R]QOF76156.1 hypothetical protein IG196_17320 [Variovorax sp. 38R]